MCVPASARNRAVALLPSAHPSYTTSPCLAPPSRLFLWEHEHTSYGIILIASNTLEGSSVFSLFSHPVARLIDVARAALKRA